MTDELRALLNQVAEGRVDPTEAAQRLADLDHVTTDPWATATDHDPATGSAPSAAAPDQPGQASAGPATGTAVDAAVTGVRVQASGRPVRVVGDASIATVAVDGPHTVRREGGRLRVDAPVAGGNDPDGSYRYERKTGLSRWISQATLLGVPMTVRVNPQLPVDVELLAGSLDMMGLRAPTAFSVTAGSVRATDCSGPVDGTIRAGSAKLELRPTQGSSTVRVESGSVYLRLDKGSDVRLRAHAELGEVKVAGGAGSGRVVDREGSHEVVVGRGTATMDVDIVMGSLKVATP